MVERSLSMREVPGSIPGISIENKFLIFVKKYILFLINFLARSLSLCMLQVLIQKKNQSNTF